MSHTPTPLPETIEDKHVRSAVAVALKLARYRPSRHTTENDAICAAAADAVMESFRRAGWRVVKDGDYPGFGPSDTHPLFKPIE